MEGMREEKRTTGSDVFLQGRVFLVQVFVQAKIWETSQNAETKKGERRERGGREDERRSGRLRLSRDLDCTHFTCHHLKGGRN